MPLQTQAAGTAATDTPAAVTATDDQTNATGSTPAAGTATDDQTSATGSGPGDLAAELERTREALKRVNAESATRRKRIEALEAEANQLADLRSQIADRDQRIASMTIDAAIIAEANRRSFHNSADAVSLIDRSAIKLDGDKPTGITEAIETLIKDRPHLIKTTTPPETNATASGRGGGLADAAEIAARKRDGAGGAYSAI